MGDASIDDPLLAALAALHAWCESLGLPYAVIGGIAVSLQATPRSTRDVDAVILVEDDRWAEILDAAAGFGVTARVTDPIGFARRTRVLLLQHDSGVPLDVSCGLLPFEHAMVEHADTLQVGLSSLRVARPADLLVLKAVANRPQDKADIDLLLQAHPSIDLAAVRRVVVEFADALETPEILADFEAAVRRRGR